METTPFTARMVAYKSTTDNPGSSFDSQTDRGCRFPALSLDGETERKAGF